VIGTQSLSTTPQQQQVSDAMRDATYGAMDASRFVVSHHLRSQQMFEREAARAKAQPAWSPLLGPPDSPPPPPHEMTRDDTHEMAPRVGECEAWPAVRAEAGGASAELQAAMRTFECCQQWKLCRLGPAAK